MAPHRALPNIVAPILPSATPIAAAPRATRLPARKPEADGLQEDVALRMRPVQAARIEVQTGAYAKGGQWQCAPIQQ